MYKFIIFLLTLTLALLYWQYRLLRKGKNNLIWLALRMGICLTILVTILVPTYHLPMASPIEILLVDNSYSMASSVDAAWETVSTFEETHQKEKHGILLFSGKTVSIYDDAQSIESLKASFYESYAKSSVTDLASAIGTIENHYGTSQALNITLLTDGYVTEMLPTLEDFPDSWSLTTLPLITDQNIDVALDDLRLLKTAKSDLRQAKSIQLSYTSQMSGNGIFILTSSMGEVFRTDITVEKGKYTIDLACDFSLDADPIKGQLMISGDENPHNNTVKLICPESQKLSFLVISDMNNWDRSRETLGAFLAGEEIVTSYIEPNKINSPTLSSLAVDGYIIDNCSGDAFTEEGLLALKNAIANEGKGCFLIAGNQTFGLGNYSAYGLEEILPLEDRLSGPEQQGSSAVIVVLDSSGSMADTSSGTKKITLAKSGIQAVIDQLHPEDMMGVIGFSDVYEWLQPLASVKAINTDAIDFKTLGAKGGTLIKPSLVVAYEAMKNVSTEKEKHILLITDGQGEQEGYEDLLTQFKKHQITLSCIGIGDDIAADFLSGLSIGSNGSFYQVSDINTLPKIMVRDIYKHGKEILQEGIFEVTRAETAEKDGSNARVKRYVATTSKPDSKVLLKLNTFDPLLVTGSYGGGKVCALTTSLSEDWSGDLLEYYGSEIMDILKHLVLTTDSRALSVSRDGNRLTIVPINSNLIKVDLLYHGNIIESFSDIILNQPMMHSVGDASGTYQINGYNLANQMIASNTIEFEYSAEHQLSTSPLWEDHPELFNITALKSQERVIKTRYLTWPLICMLFLFSIYYRGK